MLCGAAFDVLHLTTPVSRYAGTLFTMARLINENVPGFIDDKAR
jgi:hypothetical protein